ncbi:Ankyrin-R-like protein [Cladobotryum mycophilum]|uniref:Ankyrin-R-like protein n=1 Tax=Cladobotryum mycophilum TaxID=491253 RepID=A0ABR0SAF5_9HYPO
MATNDGFDPASPEPHEGSLDVVKRQYVISLIGLDTEMQELVSSLVPTADIFTFASPGFSPHDIDTASNHFLDELNNFYTERKSHIKRMIILASGFGGFLIKQALVIANQNVKYRELAIVICDLVFLSTPHRYYHSLDPASESLIRAMIPPSALIPEFWFGQLVGHIDIISAAFRRISRNYNITNLLQPQHDATIDIDKNPWTFGNGVELNVDLKGSLEASVIYNSIKDLTCLYNCLAPLHLLRDDTIFEATHYIDCLERLSWSWLQVTNPLLPDDANYMESGVMEQLISQFKLHEHESGKYPSSVCLFGASGSGKTALIQTIPLTLEGYKNIIPVTFAKRTFRATNPTIVDILNSFLYQILSYVPSAFSRVNHYYQSLRNQDIWTEQLLWVFVAILMRNARGNKVVLIIDEITDWPISHFEKLAQNLSNLNQSGIFGLQVIYTAINNQPSLIPGPTLCINMANEEIYQRAIRMLIRRRAIDEQLENKSSAIKSAIDCELDSISDHFLSTYLYLRHISRLSTVTTPAILGRNLSISPHKREEFYQFEMEVLSKKDQDILRWCWSSLSWLLQAIHPLTVAELSVAVALHQMGPDMSKDEIKNHMSVKMWDDLDHHLGLLICKDRRSLVTMVHDTAEEFIHRYVNTAEARSFRLASHTEITKICLHYLETVLPPWAESNFEKEQSEYGLVRYAAEYWPKHYQLATSEIGLVNQTDELDQQVLDFLSHQGKLTSWLKIYQTTMSRLMSVNLEHADRLEVACGLGQTSIVPRILDDTTRQVVNDKPLLQRSLDAAVSNGQSAIVPILLQVGCQSEIALCFAAEKNMVDVVEQLLKQAERPGGMGFSLDKAVTAAATHGCLQAIIKIWDYFTDDPDQLFRLKGLALDCAVSGGHTPLVSFLLQPQGLIQEISTLLNPPGPTLTILNSDVANITLDSLNTNIRHQPLLDVAAESGESKIVSLLLAAGARVTNSALEHAAKQPNINTVQVLLQALKPQDLLLEHCQAVHLAAERGYLNIVTELLESGVEIDGTDDLKQTPLHKAATRGHTEIVRLLLERGANRNAYDGQSLMPCHLAAQGGHIETYQALQENAQVRHDDLLVDIAVRGGHLAMVKYLLSLSLRTVSMEDRSILNAALLEAASCGYLSIVRELCEAGLDLSSRTGTTSPFTVLPQEAKRTPLHLGVAFPKVVRVLLSKPDVDVDALDLDQRSPLHIAALLKQSTDTEESMEMLLKAKAEVNGEDEKRNTPLHLAATNGYSKLVKLLLEAGANPNIINITGESPLHCAADSKRAQEGEAQACVAALLNRDAEMNIQDNNKQTPLHRAALSGLVEPLRALLEKGADVTIPGRWGRSAFTQAVQRGFLEPSRLLLEKGSDINGHSLITPLYLASAGQNTNLVRLLLDHGADYTILPSQRWSALHVAADNGTKETVQLLLDRGLAVGDTDMYGNTALHFACNRGSLEKVKLLLEHDANINAVTNRGITPLQRAVANQHLAVIRHLVDAHADRSIKDESGYTALEWAIQRGLKDVVAVLEEADATNV